MMNKWWRTVRSLDHLRSDWTDWSQKFMRCHHRRKKPWDLSGKKCDKTSENGFNGLTHNNWDLGDDTIKNRDLIHSNKGLTWLKHYKSGNGVLAHNTGFFSDEELTGLTMKCGFHHNNKTRVHHRKTLVVWWYPSKSRSMGLRWFKNINRASTCVPSNSVLKKVF